MLEAVGEVFPEAKYQRCTVHFYRNVFSVTPRSKVKLVVAKMLKAIHAQESKKAAREKAKTGGRGTTLHEAERGRQKGGGWHRGNADLLRFFQRALNSYPHQ